MLDPTQLATLSEDELARTLGVDSATLAHVKDTIAQDPRATIEPDRASADTAGKAALDGLGAQSAVHRITAGLTVDRTLGEGGMGVVRLATQESLGRKVAVKTLRPEGRSSAATLRLLREAWVTGSLEHPNIVPVYDLGLDDSGSPVIVLKRIEGAPWDELMNDAAAVRARFGAEDLLEYNLRILISLCNAVSLAHARGVLHRDLKPDNVMIGSFGEVYLVDWGIAVSLRDDPTGRLPRAADATEMAGTPCYMAPEMLGAGALSERTDVYLLGSVLHEVLTGEPPHQGTFRQIVASILTSSPTYADDVPPELAAIARRAMSREPDARFESVEALRKRLEWYLRHRGSLALSSEASRSLAALREIARAGAGSPESSGAAARDRVYRLLAECRFGFRQALAASEDNDAAREGLREAIATAVRYELARGTPEAAAAVLGELDDPPADLAEQVAAALRAREADKARIERLERLDADLDPSIGRRTRVFVASVLVLVWSVLPQVGAATEDTWSKNPREAMYGWTLGLLALCFLAARWGRQSLTKTLVNRRAMTAALLSFAAQLALEVGATILGMPFTTTLILHFFVWFFAVASLAAFVDRRLWPAAGGYLAGFFVAAAMPVLKWHVMTAANLVLLANVVLAWGSLDDRPVLRLRDRARRRERS